MKTLLLFIPFLFVCSIVIGQSYKIIGKTIKIGKLEVAQFDFPNRLIWNDAKKACTGLGNGWRLPTKSELDLLYINKDKIGGFADDFYWSSTESSNNYAWLVNFYIGYQDYSDKKYIYNVRAVRAF